MSFSWKNRENSVPALEEAFLISLLLKCFLLTLSHWGTVPSYPGKRLVSCDFNGKKLVGICLGREDRLGGLSLYESSAFDLQLA